MRGARRTHGWLIRGHLTLALLGASACGGVHPSETAESVDGESTGVAEPVSQSEPVQGEATTSEPAPVAPEAETEPAGPSQAPRDAPAMKGVLCGADELSDAECDGADYELAGTLDLHGDDRRARVFTLTAGGPDLCHVRAACFTVVERHPDRWRVLLRSMGSTVGALPSGREGYRDLRVTGADSAESWTVGRYRWDPSAARYRSAERVSCTLDDEADAPLCQSASDDVALQ